MKTKLFTCLIAFAVLLGLFGGCAKEPEISYNPTEKLEGSELYVQKVENLAEDFIFGMDASAVPSLEASGVKYYNYNGEEQDVFQTLAQSGINYIRVRVWNDPFDAEQNGYGGGNCNIDTAVAIGQRATKYGMKLLVNFHYSDFWADPAKQMVPKAWKGMTIEEKTDALYAYTVESLNKLKDTKVDVGMVQIGNETTGGMSGETDWAKITTLMQAGSKAVREVFPDAMVAIHFANPEKAGSYSDHAKRLDYYGVDYDVFASSYYPFWHGTLENLTQVLTKIHETYHKKVMVVETSYAYTAEDSDFNGNTIGQGSLVTQSYPYTVQGQATCIRDVIQCVANIPGGIGVCYWEGTWITVGQNSWEENHEKWEKFGSGWASSHAAGYDPEDAGKYYGGCAVDNQALFDPNGKPLDSLRIFNLVRYGNDTAPKADALEDVHLTVDLGNPVELPQTVNAIMTDGSKAPVAVTWDVTEEKLQTMSEGGKHQVSGTAQGMPVQCHVTVMEVNYLENYSFESGDATGWILEDLASADQLYVEDKVTDSLTGNYHLHFWSAAKNSVEFTCEQPVQGLSAGNYQFSISIMGGDAGEATVYAYVKINGEMVKTAPMTITTYGNWDTGTISGIAYTEGDALVVGIYVKCSGSGSGAWGKIDDAMLNKER